jgi:hypothetical protein
MFFQALLLFLAHMEMCKAENNVSGEVCRIEVKSGSHYMGVEHHVRKENKR